MRSSHFLTSFLCAASLSFPALSCAQTVIKLQAANKFLIVPVSVNKCGPYPFVLDTGSNRTLIRNELLRTLGISSKTLVPVNMLNGVSYLHQTIVESVAVAGLSVNDFEIVGIDADKIAMIGTSIQGVLGEDFLKHFDLLIDNRAKTLTMDDGPDLAQVLAGDHLPLSFFGMRGNQASINRPVIDLELPPGQKMHFLVDSGSNFLAFFPSGPPLNERNSASESTAVTPAGNSRCHVNPITLRIGKSTKPHVGLVSCEGVTRDNVDVDGTLPTSVFDRFFISHSGAYAILNPHLQRPSRRSLPWWSLR